MWAIHAAAGASGVASHFLYFLHGEHHLWGAAYVNVFCAGFVASVVALVNLNGHSQASALTLTTTIALSYFAGLYLSILVYRLFFHPLNKFPGPLAARISTFWLITQTRNVEMHHHHERLHEKYGRYVRTGPNVLNIADADIHKAAYGPDTKVRKADWYDSLYPLTSMHFTRDRKDHDARRRGWVPAFSDKALREYEHQVRRSNDLFVQRVREHAGGPMNMGHWFLMYSFDVMGQMALGRDFGMLESGEMHWAVQTMLDGVGVVPLRTPTWAIQLLVRVPFAMNAIKRLMAFELNELRKRVARKEEGGDVVGWLLKAYRDVAKPADDVKLLGDTHLVIVAGSDTTAGTLTYALYELAKKPDEVRKLRAELQRLTAGKEAWGDVDVKTSVHFQGIIFETLRLHPAVPSGAHRKVPAEGLQVGDVFLPGGTEFWAPTQVIQRDEDYFERALDFVPERWFSQPNMIKHRTAWAPFSMGAENCIGKNLAMMEMRTLLAQLILNFDFALAPHDDGTRIIRDEVDAFIVRPGRLEVVFTPLT